MFPPQCQDQCKDKNITFSLLLVKCFCFALYVEEYLIEKFSTLDNVSMCFKDHFYKYSKTCLKRSLIIDKTKILKTNGSLMKVESIAECSL